MVAALMRKQTERRLRIVKKAGVQLPQIAKGFVHVNELVIPAVRSPILAIKQHSGCNLKV